MPIWVVLNGPSSQWLCRPPNSARLYGCNLAYRDWPITDLVCVDRMSVAQVRGDPEALKVRRFYTRTSALELPPGWQAVDPPGIDSGSLAVQIALEQNPDQQILIIGADGIMLGQTKSRYQYRWHPRGPGPRIHLRHRQAMIAVHNRWPGRISVVWCGKDTEIPTISPEQINVVEPGLLNILQGEVNGQTSDNTS